MFGYYGKLPSQGDFIRHHADVAFVRSWDQWLQEGISASRAQLGAGWQTAYENAPIWRFCLGAGLCGPEPLIGVLMPSADRVGRCFPLTLFLRLKTGVSALALDAEPLMTEMEEVALSALDPNRSKDKLNARIAILKSPELPRETNPRQSHWLTTFFAGKPQRQDRSFDGMPEAAKFVELLIPEAQNADV